MKEIPNLVREIDKGQLRKGGDSDIKNYLFGILINDNLQGLKNAQIYKQDYIINSYNFDKIQEDVLHVYEGLNNYYGEL